MVISISLVIVAFVIRAAAKQILNLIEERHLADGPLAARISFNEVHPDQRRYWGDNDRCHIQLVFEL